MKNVKLAKNHLAIVGGGGDHLFGGCGLFACLDGNYGIGYRIYRVMIRQISQLMLQ